MIVLRCSASNPKTLRMENNSVEKKDEHKEPITKSTIKIALIIDAKKVKGYSSINLELEQSAG